jgi:hypothetical protein
MCVSVGCGGVGGGYWLRCVHQTFSQENKQKAGNDNGVAMKASSS